jgi:polar amino acid transport system substrate-binding protein
MRTPLLAALCLLLLGALCAPAAGGTLEKIKSRGYLIAGVQDSVVPFGYVDQGTQGIVGFDVDICRQIADKLGVDLKLKPVSSSNRISMLAQGSVDMLAATMTHTFTREKSIDFSLTYFQTGQRILVSKGSGIESADDLAGKSVGVVRGSSSEKNIKHVQPDCEVRSFESYPKAFAALQQSGVNALTSDATILLGLKNSSPNPDSWRIVGDSLSHEPYGLGLPENDSDFRDFVNKALVDMWNSGVYHEIYTKWFGPKTQYYLPLEWEMVTWPY